MLPATISYRLARTAYHHFPHFQPTMKRTKHYDCDIQKIAVIGAGSAGIAAAKYLVAENAFQNVTVLEQRASSGGMWNYTPVNDPPPPPPPRSLLRFTMNWSPIYLRP